MIRLAASTGLKPWEFMRMTPREFELWCEGRQIDFERDLEKSAWEQANLINVHIPRGKPRLRKEKIFKPSRKPWEEATVDMGAPGSEAEVLAKVRAVEGARDAKD